MSWLESLKKFISKFGRSTARAAERELMKKEKLREQQVAKYRALEIRMKAVENEYRREQDDNLRKIVAARFEELQVELESLINDINLNNLQLRQLRQVLQVAGKPLLDAQTLRQFANDTQKRWIELQMATEELKGIDATIQAMGGFATEVESTERMAAFEQRMQQHEKVAPPTTTKESATKKTVEQQRSEPTGAGDEILVPDSKLLPQKKERETQPPGANAAVARENHKVSESEAMPSAPEASESTDDEAVS